jgi:hypothetical protein
MKSLLPSSGMRYAVIQIRTASSCPEQLVLAYQDEKSLRELIARPSIVGLGFSSREEANLLTRNPAPTKTQVHRHRLFRKSGSTAGFSKSHGFFRRTLRAAVTRAAVFLSPISVLSASFRATR